MSEPITDGMEITPEEANAADAAFKEAMAVNLDEVVQGTVTFNFCDYIPDPDDPDARIEKWRKVTLSKRVPMSVFNAVIASRKKVFAARKTNDENSDAISLEFMCDAVLRVFRLKEPKMTMERMVDGLDNEVIQALFARFFERTLSLGMKKATSGGNTNNANGSSPANT
jgi:hypothetical protein